jgi:hypothetical protein
MRRALSSVPKLKERAPLDVKGKSNPVPIYSVVP